MAWGRADLANPLQVYADPIRRDVYLKMHGNIFTQAVREL
jgi:hypothetical protein